MIAGDTVRMRHPDGHATVTGSGGQFIGWIPNGITGTIYLLTADRNSAVVNFQGKLLATVAVAHLEHVAKSEVHSAA